MTDVTNPPHYTAGGIECIDYLEAKLQGRDGFEGFCIGNAIKYLTRADMKGPGVEDYKKARWYVDRLIANREAADAAVDAPLPEPADEWALPVGWSWRPSLLVQGYEKAVCDATGEEVYLDERRRPGGQLHLACPDVVALVKRRNGVTT